MDTKYIDIVATTDRLARDPVARDLIRHLDLNAASLGLTDATVYCDFPVYTDNDGTPYSPDLLLVSPLHGVIPIRTSSIDANGLLAADATMGQF